MNRDGEGEEIGGGRGGRVGQDREGQDRVVHTMCAMRRS